MAKDRFPKQGTYAWFFNKMDGISVAKVEITKKWVDKEVYSTPTQVATVRVIELYGYSKHYQINSKIIIDDPEQLAFNEKSAIRRIYEA